MLYIIPEPVFACVSCFYMYVFDFYWPTEGCFVTALQLRVLRKRNNDVSTYMTKGIDTRIKKPNFNYMTPAESYKRPNLKDKNWRVLYTFTLLLILWYLVSQFKHVYAT